jgi:hypothetical protein
MTMHALKLPIYSLDLLRDPHHDPHQTAGFERALTYNLEQRPASHAGNRGSKPLGGANFINDLAGGRRSLPNGCPICVPSLGKLLGTHGRWRRSHRAPAKASHRMPWYIEHLSQRSPV